MQHNLPLATANHLGPLFKAIFPDSKIAKGYTCGQTKATAIINKALGPDCNDYLVQHCKTHPFSLGIDGSSDTDVDKMNPVTMRVLMSAGRKRLRPTSTCVTSGRDAAKPDTFSNCGI